MRAVPLLWEFYPGICLTTEEKVRKTLSQGKKNLSQSTVYILLKLPHITKPTHTQTHTIQNSHKYTHITKPTHTHTHTLQNPHIHTPTHYKTHTKTHTHTLQNPHKNTHTHTLQNPHIHTPTHYKTHTNTHTHTHTLQNNIKPKQYKLKQTQCKLYPNEIVTI